MAIDFLTNIEHVVVLMLENRSFDHMAGWFGKGDGLRTDLFNPEQLNDPASPKVFATRDAHYTDDLAIDPSHALLNVNVQLFGTSTAPQPATGANLGFVADYATQPGQTAAGARGIMNAFDPAKLPVMKTLADEFVLCDRWFSSVPGQTWPNRFFMHAATSGGFVDNVFRDYKFKTIYDNLAAAGYPWSIYFHDMPQTVTMASLRKKEYLTRNFKPMAQFHLDLRTGNLPAYSFIEPRYFDFRKWKANDQHPPHDVALGEHLIADVYEALRRSSAWESTLFFVLYDEHGGIYDHVCPPACSNPDGKVSVNPPFDFTRLGLRVPTLVISPYVQKGVVDSTQYDHTSILATVKELFNLPHALTQRDREANTTSRLLQSTARTDAPLTLPRPPAPAVAMDVPVSSAAVTAADTAANGAPSQAPLSEFQVSLIETADALTGAQPASSVPGAPTAPTTEHEGAVHVRRALARLLLKP